MGEVTIDPNIYIEPSLQLRNILENIPDPTENIRKVLKHLPGSKLVAKDLDWLRKNVSKEEKRNLYSALLSSEVTLPSPVYPERNPELEKRCQKLRIQQADKEYKKMTRNIRESELQEKPLSLQFKELNGILVMMFQFLVSVAASFMFGYLAPYYLYGRTDTGARIIFGTIIAFCVGIADLYFVIRENLSDDGIEMAKKSK